MYNSQLDTFIRVADAGSFSKAAELLYISPNAVIKQINLLESHLELRLFVRTYKGIALTQAGQSLYRDAKYIMQYSRDSIVRAKDSMQDGGHVIRIGSSPMTPTQFLMELWSRIHPLCPELKFQLVPFENTPENAREIMKNFGQNIDLVAGLYDDELLRRRKCAGLLLSSEPICCAVSIHHRLAGKDRLSVQDLFGENLMMIHRGWNRHVDQLREDIVQKYPQITIVDFPFYDVSVFNECENGNQILMAIDMWANVHPLLKIIPVEWDHVIPFGLLFSPQPSEYVRVFLHAVARLYEHDAGRN